MMYDNGNESDNNIDIKKIIIMKIIVIIIMIIIINLICEIFNLVVIFGKNEMKNTSIPKFSTLPPISDDVLPQLCSDDPIQILFKMPWFLTL